ncbi:MAG: VWA domain-containing protein [Saprospiraceae bacterium]|nr:VWA domain-containing protein [Saprospiraceae bacterium]
MKLTIGSIAFVSPWYLLLLLLLPLIYYWLRSNRSKYYTQLTLSSLTPVRDVRGWRERLMPLRQTLWAGGLILLILALARPQRTLQEEEVKAEGIDITLVMDLSSSMLAKDFQPDRLEASKAVAIEFVDKRPYDRFGLVVFSGESYTMSPLTMDHQVIQELLSGLQCGLLDDGTAIGMGLASAVNRLKESKAKSKVIILLTDGVNNRGYIQPMQAAEIAKQFNIKVYTIGVGTAGEALTPVSRRSDGQYVFGYANVEIDENLLKQIAGETGGQYFRALNETGLRSIYDEIDQLEKTEMEVTVFKRYKDLYRSLAWAGLALLLIEFLLGNTLLKTLP